MKESDLNLINQVVADVKNGNLYLPSPPEFAQKLHEAIAENRRDISYVARIIQYDPGLTARLIEIANSPLFRGKSQVESCKSAVTRIGMKTTRHYIYAFTLNNAFNSSNAEIQGKMDDIWVKSRELAVLCFVIAGCIPGMDQHRALMAGLIHNIGMIPVLAYAEKNPALLENPARLTLLAEKLNPKMGPFLLKKWNFDAELASIPAEIEDWFRKPAEDIDYADVVNIARIYNAIGKPEFSGLPRLVDLPAYKKLPGNESGPEACLAVLEDADMEMSVVSALL